MSRRNLRQIADVAIRGFTKKGNGLGVTQDARALEVEVPFAIPGDVVRAELSRKKSGVFASQLKEVVKPSPQRIEARCAHFAVCGGCRWQQMEYQEQLNLKQKLIETLFAPLLPSDVLVRPIVPSDPHWQYRNKMEYTFSSDLAGNQYLGLIIDGSRGKVLNLSECHLVSPWFMEALSTARRWWQASGAAAYHPHTNKGALRTLTVREGMRTRDRAIMLTVSGNPEDALTRQQLESFTSCMREALQPQNPSEKLSLMLRIQQAIKGQETQFFEMELWGPDSIEEILYIQKSAASPAEKLVFALSPSAFFQPNPTQAEKLYSLSLQLLDISKGSVVYDLYCGTGTLGIAVAKEAKMVVGIEISPESSLDARTNAARNGLSNVHILTGPASDVIGDILKQQTYPLPDVVMVDPPRVGLDAGILQHIATLNAPKLLYISCNPTTQVENLLHLTAMGYKIKAVQPVDQFPHTVHMENIVALEKE